MEKRAILIPQAAHDDTDVIPLRDAILHAKHMWKLGGLVGAGLEEVSCELACGDVGIACRMDGVYLSDLGEVEHVR